MSTKVARDLSSGEAAKFCFVSIKTVCKWLDDGTLKGYRVPGTEHRRFRPADVFAFLKEHEIPVSKELADMV